MDGRSADRTCSASPDGRVLGDPLGRTTPGLLTPADRLASARAGGGADAVGGSLAAAGTAATLPPERSASGRMVGKKEKT